jgi:hypothetical protein
MAVERTLEERLRRLEDKEEIRALASLYSLSVDDHDFDTLTGLFAPDAVYGWMKTPNPSVGGAQIGQLLRSRIGEMGPSFHVNHDHIVHLDDADSDRASGLVFCHAEVSSAKGHFLAAIRYHDKYVRHDGRWKFGERLLGFLYYVSPDDYSGILRRQGRLTNADPAAAAHWPAYDVNAPAVS